MSALSSLGDVSAFHNSQGSSRDTANASFSSGVDARVLSQATSQATLAAKSILSSGGTQQTALKTAQAAAQGVLLGHEKDMGSGPKAMMKRRRIKKQAEVVASMALASANSGLEKGTEWDALSQGDFQANPRQQIIHIQTDAPSTVTAGSSTVQTQHSGSENRLYLPPSQRSNSSRNVKRPPLPTPQKAPFVSSTSPFAGRYPALTEEGSSRGHISEMPSGDEGSDEESEFDSEIEKESLTRKVAIRVETTRKTQKSDDITSSRNSAEACATVDSGENSDYYNNCANSTKKDDIFKHEYESGASSEDFSDDISAHSLRTVEMSFMASAFDPLLTRIANAFACGEPDHAEKNREFADQPRLSTPRSPSKSSSRKAKESREAEESSCSSVESNELFRSLKSYDDYLLSDESDDSFVKPKQRQSLRDKMEEISRRGEIARHQSPRAQSHSEDDDESSESNDESYQSVESYQHAMKNANKFAKPWNMLKNVSRKTKKG